MDTLRLVSATLLVALALLTPLAVPLRGSAPAGASFEEVWRLTVNPTPGYDFTGYVCAWGGRVYHVGLFGWRSEVKRWTGSRIEVVDLGTGRPLAHRKYEGVYLAFCLVVDGVLYAGGWLYAEADAGVVPYSWYLAAISAETLDVLREVRGVPGYASHAVVREGVLLVFGASAPTAEDSCWRVELRELDDLELVALYESNPSEGADYPQAVGVNPATGHVWLVGSVREARGPWYVEILEVLDRNLTRVGSARHDAYFELASSIAFDEEGYAYVGGRSGLAKLGRDGAIVKAYAVASANDVAYSGGVLYVVLSRVSPEGDRVQVIVQALGRDLEVLGSLELNVSVLPGWARRAERVVAVGDKMIVLVNEHVRVDKSAVDPVWTLVALRVRVERPAEETAATATPPLDGGAAGLPLWALAALGAAAAALLAVAVRLLRR